MGRWKLLDNGPERLAREKVTVNITRSLTIERLFKDSKPLPRSMSVKTYLEEEDAPEILSTRGTVGGCSTIPDIHATILAGRDAEGLGVDSIVS